MWRDHGEPVALNVRSSETRRRALGANRISETQHANRSLHLPLLFAVSFLSPSPSFVQLNVITSVGFAAAFSFPLFKRAAGLQLRQSTSRCAAMDPIPLRHNFAQGWPRTSSS
jgi:hypothetical protein